MIGLTGAPKKPPIMKKNVHEFNKHKLHPFYKTRDFRKKIAFIYYPVMLNHIELSNGRFPVFKLSKTNTRLKPGTASTSSIRNTTKTVHNKNQSIPTSFNYTNMTRENVANVYTQGSNLANFNNSRVNINKASANPVRRIAV